MKCFAVFAVVAIISASLPSLTIAQERDDFVSDASHTIGTYKPSSIDHSPEAIANAANAFLESLNDQQLVKAMHKLDSRERQQWTNLPARDDAGGLTLGEMNQEQVRAACDLLANMVSPEGYAKMRDIMLADDQLITGGRAARGIGTETFAIVIFGEPSATNPWGFQLDGHHIALNVSLHGDDYEISPSLVATQPEKFKIAGKEIRPMTGEIDLAYELAGSLTQEQLREALVDTRRGQLVTGPGRDGYVPESSGLSCTKLTDDQKETLVKLISHWVNIMPEKHASVRMKQVEAEVDEMYFAWWGPTDARSNVSYRVQGPTLIIEFACQQSGPNPLDHLHTMYRDPTNEYGKQIED